ncbi:MAG: hypothetical protein A3E31_16835 [Candidatus Rokubacteria bacterium RIFCSPHIGHO2_12_FULL_73_22]|nr:MAG: hypothetical protein A3E31_16835 [Candidatus Rokubacteria bacterium RIFCSPHIGHO2_12_FULL_73_22]OGL10016.1 MAG: hypothetical protein A3I14_16935 [Candidatus Rokubacteria bacterium RIFCSPLOWO2_02_FULL_73_56]OGL22944.1 MAG: hypothetical protein A3G44_17725 [Candidatus Rokubacteria bacterium RIFCSPLOWO2_12_FULL_73_47]
MDGASETTRREALKLAAAVAAFGTALGFHAIGAEAQGPSTGATQQKVIKGERTTLKFLKIERLEIKLFYQGKFSYAFSVPSSVHKHFRPGQQLELKFFRNGEFVTDPLK